MKDAFKHYFDVRYLITLKEIATIGTFSGAAKNLEMTQGAVSNQIKILEKTFNIKIFERNSNGVALTSEGASLLAQSYKLQKMMEETYNLFGISSDGKVRTIRVSSGQIAAITCVPEAIKSFRKAEKDVEFLLETANALTCLLDLQDDRADVAVVGSVDFNEFKNRDAYIVNKLFERDIVAIVPPDHNLARREKVSLDELLKYQFIGRRYGSAVQSRVDDILRRRTDARNKARSGLFFENSSSIISAVSEGYGVSVIADVQVRQFEKKGLVKTIKLDPPLPKIAIYGVMKKNCPYPLAHQFFNLLTKFKAGDV